MIVIHRRDPSRRMARFYAIDVHPDLFGVSLLREWGRIGRQGRVRIEGFADPTLAEAAARRIEGRKRRRGYG